MRKAAHVGMVVLLLTMVSPLMAEDVEAESVKGLFVVVTSDEPQTQMMAMVLAAQTVAKNKTVEVLLCGPAADMALKFTAVRTLKPSGQSPKDLLADLIRRKVPVHVCALYLPNNGHSKNDLIDGVTPADPPVIADALLAPGVKLFTF